MTLALAVFLASLAVLFHTYAGYPLLLALWARLAPRPVRRAPFTPEVAIVVVVHNGETLVRPKIASCLAQDYPAEHLRVLVVSDGSDDGTVEAVESAGHPGVRVLAFAERRGKAACLNDAMAACPEEFLVLTDVRQRLDPLAVRRLLENLADPDVGAVSGELFFERDGLTGFAEGMDAYWRYETFIRRKEGEIHSVIGVSGALYALRRSCFRPIPAETILDDVLIPMQVVAQGRRVVFESGAIAFDRPSAEPRQERARKVRTLAGNFQLLARHPFVLAPWRHPVVLQFVSHKAFRLAGPPALVAALAGNVALAPQGGWFAVALALQAAGYGLAAVGALLPAARAIRIVRLAHTFFSLNWFVVLGFLEFATNRRAHLWARSVPPTSGAQRAP